MHKAIKTDSLSISEMSQYDVIAVDEAQFFREIA